MGSRTTERRANAADECFTALAGGFSFKDQTMTELDIHYRTAFDFRATDDEAVPGFEGYASTHWAADSYWTAMAPGAFKKTIRERTDKIPVLWNHNPNSPIGKHLALKEDKTGLYVNIGIADDGAEGSTFLKRMRFGVPFGMSFGF